MNPKHIGLFSLLLLVLGVGVVTWLGGHLHRPLMVSEPRTFEVESGQGLSRILLELQREGALGEDGEARIRHFSARLYDLFTGVSQRIHVGEYRLAPDDTLLALLNRLERGEVVQRTFTLVEGWNIRELRQALAETPGLQPLTLEWDDNRLMAELGKPAMHPEGWFAPDTYFYVRGDTDLALLERALARQQQLLEQIWLQRQEALPLNSAYEALILASIIEKETGVPEERPAIGGVFVSRLKIGMRLQTDPTVIYGMGADYDGNIRRRDLRTPTPYNTYVISGLPPTPIAMPGAEALLAAVQPDETGALYFVARGDGSHVFSETLEQHEAAVRQYQLQRRSDYRSSPGGSQ